MGELVDMDTDAMNELETVVEAASSIKSRGRPRLFDHDQALDKALDVFWKRGYEGASLSELTDALGINRPSLYAAFGNKEELFRKALDRYIAGPVAYASAALQQPTARKVVETFLTDSVLLLTDPKTPHGCMLVQGALTCGEGAQAISKLLADCRNSFQDALRLRLERAKLDGDLPATSDAAGLARYVATIHQGMSVQGTSGATHDELLGVIATVMANWPSA